MSEPGEIAYSRPAEGTLCLRLSGRWTLDGELPALDAVEREIDAAGPLREVTFDASAVADWDTGLLTFLHRLGSRLEAEGIREDRSGLPEGARRLLDLAAAVPEQKDARKGGEHPSFLERVGRETLEVRSGARDMLGFVGEAAVAFGKLLVGRARFRRSDLVLILRQCGADALPIVSLVSFLVGLILAFVGAVQLRQFGAEIFVADLGALGMAREMGAMMAAIIMAGRTGAAFAAQLGTMTVNEEIDALRTLGIDPMEFLVLPRMVSLMVMLPLLSLYADLLGMLGGLVVGVGMLDLGTAEYYAETRRYLALDSFGWGLTKAMVYGTLVALSGCLRGMQCGRSAAAVGRAATSAVVTAIVLIVIASGVLNLLDNVIQG